MSDEEEEEEEEEEQQAMAAAGQRVEQSVRVKDDEVETIAGQATVAACRSASTYCCRACGGGLTRVEAPHAAAETGRRAADGCRNGQLAHDAEADPRTADRSGSQDRDAPAASAASRGGFRPTADAALARSNSAEIGLEEELFLCCAGSVEECTARELQFI